MTILYIETNFLMSVATGRDPDANRWFANDGPRFRLVMPGICYMEALSTLEAMRKHNGQFAQSLRNQIHELQRNRVSPSSKDLCEHLSHSVLGITQQFNDVEQRLLKAIVDVSKKAEVIVTNPGVLQDVGALRLIPNDLADNLILHTIAFHATANPGPRKALFTGNTQDFGKEDVLAFLRNVGIEVLLTNASDAIGWVRSVSTSKPGGDSP